MNYSLFTLIPFWSSIKIKYRLCWTGRYCTPRRTGHKSHSIQGHAQPVETGDIVLLGKETKFYSVHAPVLQPLECLKMQVQLILLYEVFQFSLLPLGKLEKNKERGTCSEMLCPHTKMSKQPKMSRWIPGRDFPWPWLSRTQSSLLCRPNAGLGLSTAWLKSKGSGSLVKWEEGGVGVLKQVNGVSGTGGPNRTLDGDMDKCCKRENTSCEPTETRFLSSTPIFP